MQNIRCLRNSSPAQAINGELLNIRENRGPNWHQQTRDPFLLAALRVAEHGRHQYRQRISPNRLVNISGISCLVFREPLRVLP
jgi:hypothetical protein